MPVPKLDLEYRVGQTNAERVHSSTQGERATKQESLSLGEIGFAFVSRPDARLAYSDRVDLLHGSPPAV
jgi:hypothetical protein